MQNSDIIQQLKMLYYTVVAFLTLYFALIFFHVIQLGDGKLILSDGLQRWSIAFSMAVIPLALWIFSEKLRKAARSSKEIPMEDVQKQAAFVVKMQRSYRLFSLLRLALLGGAALINSMFFGLTRNIERIEGHDGLLFGFNNFFWFSIIVIFILFVFCKPSEGELEKYTTISDATVETRRASSLQTTENDDDDDNIMWWEKGKQKTVPIDSVISENTENKNDETT